jgi:drug/metabolite transporter (DMT)-like permease
MTIQLGILLALACAFASNLAFLYKYRGARAAASVEIRHPLRSAASLFRSRWFAVGMLVAVGAWILHVGALALAPISLVQAVLSGGVVLLAVMAERLFGFKVGARQWAGVGLTAVGLILLAMTLPGSGGSHAQFSVSGMIAFEGGLIAVGALLIAGPRVGGPAEHHGIMLAAASGILFGVSDIALKALTGLMGDSGLLGLVSPWTLTAAAASVAAFYASARGLQLGEAVPIIATTATAANVTGIAGGIVVYGDPLAGDMLGLIVQLGAFAMVCAATALIPAPIRAARPA